MYRFAIPGSLLRLAIGAVVVAGSTALLPAAPGDNNLCDEPGETPDVIVGDLATVQYFGTVGDISGYSVSTESCNVGNCWLEWISSTNRHPVIGQNMYRLLDGRFEQIGQSWLKHGFFALSDNLCFSDCQPTQGDHLGVHCSDLYSSGLNGDQDRLGPRFEVNASTGVYPYPATDLGLTGNAIFKRIQVRHADMDPALNPGARYFLEGLYITFDDALAGNSRNNASHREFRLVDNGESVYTFSRNNESGVPIQQTQREEPAIQAWVANQSGVGRTNVDILKDGRVILAHAATPNGDGTWRYEYAVENITSHRSIGGFEVPVPGDAVITNIGFHDVAYHSGEPVIGTDWPGVAFPGGENVVRWSTDAWDASNDTSANAIRWGTLYNFRFDANVPPVTGSVTLGIFRPSANPNAPTEAVADGVVPDPAFVGSDSGDVEETLTVTIDGGGDLTLDWGVSCIGADTDYAVYEGLIGDFAGYASLQCTTGGSTSATFVAPLDSTYYLVVPMGDTSEGSYGRDSDGNERSQGIAACQAQAIAPCN